MMKRTYMLSNCSMLPNSSTILLTLRVFESSYMIKLVCLVLQRSSWSINIFSWRLIRLWEISIRNSRRFTRWLLRTSLWSRKFWITIGCLWRMNGSKDLNSSKRRRLSDLDYREFRLKKMSSFVLSNLRKKSDRRSLRDWDSSRYKRKKNWRGRDSE